MSYPAPLNNYCLYFRHCFPPLGGDYPLIQVGWSHDGERLFGTTNLSTKRSGHLQHCDLPMPGLEIVLIIKLRKERVTVIEWLNGQGTSYCSTEASCRSPCFPGSINGVTFRAPRYSQPWKSLRGLHQEQGLGAVLRDVVVKAPKAVWFAPSFWFRYILRTRLNRRVVEYLVDPRF